MKKVLFFITFWTCCFSHFTYSQTAQWTWISGNNTNLILQPSVYGTKGVAAPANKPGGRSNMVSWTDASGNFWLFGGLGHTSSVNGGGVLNDLWKYTPLTNQWVWLSGDTTARQPAVYGTKGVPSSANKPSYREGAVSWTDASGNLWLFGGLGAGSLNDLWKYTIATNQWTWVGGDSVSTDIQYGIYGSRNTPAAANKPGARKDAVSWIDAEGNLWLFGGDGFARPCYCFVYGGQYIGELNDLWKYNITSNQWTWVSGDSSIRQQGVYGTRGVPAPGNKPGGRQSSVSWADTSGNLWLFGGYGWPSSYGVNSLNDLWKFNIATGLWTYTHGDTTLLQRGVYGTMGVASSANKPGARYNALSWRSTGDTLWLFGGGGPRGATNDLWSYKTTTNQWTWIAGDSAVVRAGVYGTKGVAAPANKPGARQSGVTWRDAGGNLWLFGGFGFTNAIQSSYINDLWKYTLAPVNVPGPITFTANSKVTTEAGGVLDEIEAMKFQPDGKFVVAGTGGGVNFSVARYNADGSLDNTFSGDGKIVTPIGTDVDSRAYDVAIQPDGKIVVAGVVYNSEGFNLDFALVRYNADGSLDNSFDGDGVVVTDFNIGKEDQIQSLALQADGRIVVSGWSFNGNNYDVVLARYLPNGSLDPSFDADGKLSTDFGGSMDKAHTVAIQNDGKIVVGGETDNGSTYDFALARYNADGSLDASFDTDGKVVTDMEGHDYIKSMVIQSDGNIVVAGAANSSLSGPSASPNPNGNFALARYTTNGNLDNTFDGDGKLMTDLGSNDDEAYDLVLQNDGKIVVTGSSNTADFNVVRYMPNGSLDPSFYGTGITTVDFGNRPDFAHTITIYNDNLYVAGRTAGTASDDFAVAVITAPTILPLNLLRFTAARLATNKVELSWTTSAEQGISHFEVERSSNGVAFLKTGQVQALGTTYTAHMYSFTDDQSLPTTSYYRLKIVGKDHQLTYSNTIILKMNSGGKELELFPNPAKDWLQVQTSLKGPLNVTLLDATGRRIRQAEVTSNGESLTIPIDISGIEKGVYMINVQGSGKQQTATFIKQ